MIKPLDQRSSGSKPFSYTVKSLTPLQRSSNMVKLAESDEAGGFVSITSTYYDFHRPLHQPVLTQMDVFNKVMDDKLMETKYAKKVGQSSLSPLKIGGTIYRKPVY